MSFPLSHKTVFVLDRSPIFGQSCGQATELDFIKSKSSAFVAQPIKSLWTWNVECGLEYCRIVKDLFDPEKNQKLIQFVVGDSAVKCLENDWKDVDVESLLTKLAKIGGPDKTAEPSMIDMSEGLSKAVSLLAVCTEVQKSILRQNKPLKNRGRIICFTRFTDEAQVESMKKFVSDCVAAKNSTISASSESLAAIDEVELCLLNVCATAEEMRVKSHPCLKVSPTLSVELHNTLSGPVIASKVRSLVLQHFNLASTTVTNIPMKEEQNTGASANYDVELFHLMDAHLELDKGGHLRPEVGLASTKADGYRTIILKWTTPSTKGTNMEQFRLCSQAYRMTTVEVNSRPSACLSGFLLSGRTVVLELPKKVSGLKPASHMLTCHGGHLYIHTLWQGRSLFEDPPTIPDTSGGKVNDYRFTNFCDLIKECQLVPGTSDALVHDADSKYLEKVTAFWPMTFSESALFSLNIKTTVTPLLKTLRKSKLSDADIAECKGILYKLPTISIAPEVPQNSAAYSRFRGMKSKDLLNLVWDELELFSKQYCHLSPAHTTLLMTIAQVSHRQIDIPPPPLKLAAQPLKVEPKVEVKPTKKRKTAEITVVQTNDVVVITDEPESPPPSPTTPAHFKKARVEVDHEGQPVKKLNLLAYWLDQYERQKMSRWRDFEGRKNAHSSKVELYTDLMKKLQQPKPDDIQEIASP